MDDVLLEIVLDRLDHQPLAVEATDLLLAALEGEDALAGQLSATPGERYSPPGTAVAAPDPVGAYLSSVTVKGFRGIGAAATLKVKQGPGLTLVVGRNGSGKSSFAEALEVLLTGKLMRFKDAPVPVREGWPCKHAVGDPEVTAEFYVEGKGKTTVSRSWPGTVGSDLAKSKAWMQVHGEKQEPVQALGWDADLVGYRPFLTHSELEVFFGRPPSELFDLLANVLGLEDLTAADKRLQAAAKLRDDELSTAKKKLEQLRPLLAALAGQDERADACLKALPGAVPAKWDIDGALAIATGSQQQPGGAGQLARLRGLANLAGPTNDEVTETVRALRGAAAGIAELAGSTARQAHDLAALLDTALGHHKAHGDGPCPVCGSPGALTATWHAATEQHRDRLRAEAKAAEDAIAAAKEALTRSHALVRPIPQQLATVSSGDPAATALAAAAWRSWAAAPETADGTPTAGGLLALADHLEGAYGPLMAAVTALAGQAAAELASRDDQWSPLAAELASWCGSAAPARADARAATALKAARQWLVGATAELRRERLAPLADQSRTIWADLRQESNVDLGEFRLTGANTRRQLDLDVTIDGEPGSALGVMSQGEVNALALSVFLPRATIAASPFRFLVIDDPVQAMDPAKVDGLAKVLAKVAVDRQVIVFTHGNRLTAAIRDLSIPATVLEVTRQPRSSVTVRECLDASRQALMDARSLSKDPDIPLEVAQRVIPGLCRTAAEAAFREAYWRTELRRGRTRAEVEESLTGSGTKLNLRAVAALALFGDITEAGKVQERLGRQWGHTFAATYRALNQGAHEGHPGELDNLIAGTRVLVRKIAEKLP